MLVGVQQNLPWWKPKVCFLTQVQTSCFTKLVTFLLTSWNNCIKKQNDWIHNLKLKTCNETLYPALLFLTTKQSGTKGMHTYNWTTLGGEKWRVIAFYRHGAEDLKCWYMTYEYLHNYSLLTGSNEIHTYNIQTILDTKNKCSQLHWLHTQRSRGEKQWLPTCLYNIRQFRLEDESQTQAVITSSIFKKNIKKESRKSRIVVQFWYGLYFSFMHLRKPK